MKNNLKKELARIGRLLDQKGLVSGSSGNISAKSGDTVFIKARGVSLCDAKESDFVAVSLSRAKSWQKNPRLSTEYRLHMQCYLKRKDINAVVHTHPSFATAIANANLEQKPMTVEAQILLGKKIPRLKYIRYGTQELAAAAAKALKKSDTVLLSNHGAVSVGSDLKEALNRAIALEENAKVFFIYTILKRSYNYKSK